MNWKLISQVIALNVANGVAFCDLLGIAAGEYNTYISRKSWMSLRAERPLPSTIVRLGKMRLMNTSAV